MVKLYEGIIAVHESLNHYYWFLAVAAELHEATFSIHLLTEQKFNW